MRTLAVVLALAVPAMAAGCIAPAAEDALAPSAAVEAPASVAVVEASGRIVAGGAYEAPAHFRETAPISQPLWDTMVDVAVEGAPTAIRAEMTWTGTGRVQLMVATVDEDGRLLEFVDGFTDARTLCVEVPAEAVRAGTWQLMPHTLAGADVSYTITASFADATATPHQDVAHWPGVAEYATAEVVTTPAPCA